MCRVTTNRDFVPLRAAIYREQEHQRRLCSTIFERPIKRALINNRRREHFRCRKRAAQRQRAIYGVVKSKQVATSTWWRFLLADRIDYSRVTILRLPLIHLALHNGSTITGRPSPQTKLFLESAAVRERQE